MARKRKKKDKGALEYISPKYRKDAKVLIRELGLELLSMKMVDNDCLDYYRAIAMPGYLE